MARASHGLVALGRPAPVADQRGVQRWILQQPQDVGRRVEVEVVAKRAESGQRLGYDACANVPLLFDGGVELGDVVVGGRGVSHRLVQGGDPLDSCT